MMLNILIIILAIASFSCSGGGGGGGGGASTGSVSPSILLSIVSIAQEDKVYSSDISTVLDSLSASTVVLENAPTWLTYDASAKKITGIPDSNATVSNLKINVTIVGVTTTHGPYSISINGDPFKRHQWHLKNNGQNNFASSGGVAGVDINVLPAYIADITGKNVRVAVSDSGVEISHEDLFANIIAGASKNYSLSSPYIGDPTPPTVDGSEYHGTAVAGIIAAKGWNNIGGKGVAPDAKIAGLRYIGVAQTTAATIDQASGAYDIFNYSYGDVGISPNSPSDSIAQIIYGTNNLRSTKGALYIKSAGNSFYDEFKYDSSSITLPCFNVGNGSNGKCAFWGNANFNGDENTFSQVITVGAINATGVKSSYSSPGSNIWISAFGGEDGTSFPAILSTDLQGCNKGKSSNLITPANSFDQGLQGNSNCKYTSAMNGTSSAAPIITGAIALLLEANPNLTWRDIKYILAATATKTNSNAASTSHPASLNLSGHTYQEGWIQNSAGFWFHNWYGFGLVNVANAVTLAKNYTGTLGTIKQTIDASNNWMYDSGSINLPIPDNNANGVSSTINVRHNYIIEGVRIQFLTTHQYLSDLGVELISPNGTKSILLNINSGAFFNTELPYDTELLSNAFLGEQSAGNWRIKIIDGSGGDTGSLVNWKINIIGHVNPNPSDITLPNPVSNLTHAAAYNSSNTSPSISFNASTSPDILRYEYSIGTAPGQTNTKAWTTLNNSTSFIVNSLILTLNQTYYVNVRVVDTAENISSVVTSIGWVYTASAAPTISVASPSI